MLAAALIYLKHGQLVMRGFGVVNPLHVWILLKERGDTPVASLRALPCTDIAALERVSLPLTSVKAMLRSALSRSHDYLPLAVRE